MYYHLTQAKDCPVGDILRTGKIDYAIIQGAGTSLPCRSMFKYPGGLHIA